MSLANSIPINEWETLGLCAKRFTETYKQFPPEFARVLLLDCCNGSESAASNN